LRSGFRGAVPTSLARLFPGHPGLSWNVRLNLSTSANRSVLSMNWEQSSRFLLSFNELICTGCSPNRACGKPVNNAKQPVNSSDSQFFKMNYSPRFLAKNACGEQVLYVTFQKNHARRENRRKIHRNSQRRRRDIFVETKIKMFLAPSGAGYFAMIVFRCRSYGA
jgi:hypothetical protein